MEEFASSSSAGNALSNEKPACEGLVVSFALLVFIRRLAELLRRMWYGVYEGQLYKTEEFGSRTFSRGRKSFDEHLGTTIVSTTLDLDVLSS